MSTFQFFFLPTLKTTSFSVCAYISSLLFDRMEYARAKHKATWDIYIYIYQKICSKQFLPVNMFHTDCSLSNRAKYSSERCFLFQSSAIHKMLRNNAKIFTSKSPLPSTFSYYIFLLTPLQIFTEN